MRPLIAKVNAIRRANPAFQSGESLRFHDLDNPQLIAYSKASGNFDNVMLIIVNLDPHHSQSGWTALDFGALGVGKDSDFHVQDLLSGEYYTWHGARNYVQLSPTKQVAHLLKICR